jgi:hypothetical protein
MDAQKAMELVAAINPKDQVDALNGLVLLVNVVYKRGGYSLVEAAKIWECMQKFTPEEQPK